MRGRHADARNSAPLLSALKILTRQVLCGPAHCALLISCSPDQTTHLTMGISLRKAHAIK